MSQVSNSMPSADGLVQERTGLRRFLRKKESWTKYWTKAIFVLVVMVLAGMAFASRYSIAIDPQVLRCIPEYTIYLIDHHDKNPVKDKLYAFKSKDLSPIYEEGTEMLKYLRAGPGDVVEVRSNDQVFINGKAGVMGLKLAEEKLGQPASNFHGKTTLGEDQYWFLGTSVESFDSRYWGAVKRENIVGRAYPLF